MMAQRPAARSERDDRHRRVAESVWCWQSPLHPPAPSRVRRLSGTALRDFAIGLVIGAVLYAAGRPVMAGAAAVISVVALLVRAALPVSVAAPLIAFAHRVAQLAGHALTTVVLGAVYFTVFVLLRAWRGLTGHDPLRLKRRGANQSFWIDRASLPETSPDKPY